MFSEQQRIVESAAWLNLVPENGLGGGRLGGICSEESKAKISAARKGRTFSEETKAKMSAARKGRPGKPLSEETRAKISAARKGKIRGPYKKKNAEYLVIRNSAEPQIHHAAKRKSSKYISFADISF